MRRFAIFIVGLLLCANVTHAAKSKKKVIQDTFSSVPAMHRFNAWFHLDELLRFVDQYQGASDVHCIDLYGRSQTIKNEWISHGYRALAFDLLLDPEHDVTTKAGFWQLVMMGLRLLPHGFICAGPPCSLWIFLSSSVHKRKKYGIYGNPKSAVTQLANLIVENTAVFLMLMKRRQMTYAVIEQPGSSVMFQMRAFEVELEKLFRPALVFTWLGLFGHLLCKPTKLWGNLPKLRSMKRTMTSKKRLKIKQNQEKRAEEARRRGQSPVEYYKKHSNGTVSGTKNLQDTAEYPQQFALALFRLWHYAWVTKL